MKTLLVAGAALSVALLGGCTRADKAEVNRETQSLCARVENAGVQARHAVADAALVAKVKSVLATRKGLEGADIHVEATGTVVTLKGDVNTREQAAQAEKVARETDGVTSGARTDVEQIRPGDRPERAVDLGLLEREKPVAHRVVGRRPEVVTLARAEDPRLVAHQTSMARTLSGRRDASAL